MDSGDDNRVVLGEAVAAVGLLLVGRHLVGHSIDELCERSCGLVVKRIASKSPMAVENREGADYFIRAGQAACSCSCRMPPSRSRLRTFRSMMSALPVIGSGVGCSGAPWSSDLCGRWRL